MPFNQLPINSTEITSLDEDIATVREIISPLFDAGREVILVVYSWAGVPCSSALTGLTLKERVQEGKAGGVTKLCFISAFLPKVGQSLIDALDGETIPLWIIDVSISLLQQIWMVY